MICVRHVFTEVCISLIKFSLTIFFPLVQLDVFVWKVRLVIL
jgi:hypothetical protein